jgi:hypothetical protein
MGGWWMYCHFAGVSENPTVAGDWRLPRGRNHQISPATQAEPAFHKNCLADFNADFTMLRIEQ